MSKSLGWINNKLLELKLKKQYFKNSLRIIEEQINYWEHKQQNYIESKGDLK
jgi:hypothetical protein